MIDFQDGRPMMNGYSVHVSTHVPANTMIFGNFSELLVGQWGAIALASDPYTNFNTGTVGVRAMLPMVRMDVGNLFDSIRNSFSF